jgi:hypothetical protein
MFYLLLTATLVAVGFAAGFYAGLKNANSSKVTKAKEILKSIKDE